MRPALILLAALGLASFPAHAQLITGAAEPVDGDTLDMAGVPVGLFGIDAPEAAQTCNRAGETWACGSEATQLLAELTAGERVQCEQLDRETTGRILARCKAGRLDLAETIVSAGMAVVLPEQTDAYRAAESQAQQQGLGIWSAEFEPPSAFRAANPSGYRIVRNASPERSAAPARARQASGAYRGCNEARAAGATPLYRGQPGYGAHMDGDGDGVACEDYRRR